MANRYTTSIYKDNKKTPKESKISVIILAANIGYRMKSYGVKSLYKIAKHETILDRQIENINQAIPNNEIIVVTGFEAKKMAKTRPLDIVMVENQNYENTNEIEQIRIGLNAVTTDNVLILHGDLLFNASTLRNLPYERSFVVHDSKKRFEYNSIGVTVVDNFATIFAYGVLTKWCYIIYLTGRDLKAFKSVCGNRRFEKLYTFEALNIILNKKHKLLSIEPPKMNIIKINTVKDLEKAQNENINF
jgi:GTP:adenosylcobinamide-phosphate guanylyltransferase